MNEVDLNDVVVSNANTASEESNKGETRHLSLKERTKSVERNVITSEIIKSGFRFNVAAKRLQISRATLYRKLGTEGLEEVNQIRSQTLQSVAEEYESGI